MMAVARISDDDTSKDKKMSLPGQIRFVTLKHVSSIDSIIDGSNEETTTLVGYLPPGESLAPDRHRVVVDWLTLTQPVTGTARRASPCAAMAV
jgi:hypothetical protein